MSVCVGYGRSQRAFWRRLARATRTREDASFATRFNEGPDILERAARGCPELDAALQVWKDVTFEFESTDTPDVLVTPTAA